MCGIFAWVGPGCDEAHLTRCTDRLRHRGPDASGYWSDGAASLGHRRLRIIDLTEAGAQPMFNEDGQIVVVFNGEIYNFPELRDELLAKGHVFRSRSDTEVILHAYEEYGDDCVPRFWGQFAFALWDRKRRKLLVARDRFGKKPVYYLQKGANLVLGSEIPAVLESGLSERAVDLDALSFFWQLEYIPAPYSAFQDIKQLPAGHAMVFENEQTRLWQYYPPRQVPQFRGTYAQAKDELRDLLGDATRRRLVSDVPVGVALSGGIDSAVVAASARKFTTGKLVTVTVRPHLEQNVWDEGEMARATAKALGTEHHEIRPVPDFRESFERIILNLGEPFAIASSVPCYYLFSTLKTMATVVISGDGGDELFAGYDHYRQIHKYQRIRSVMPGALTSLSYKFFNAMYGAAPPLRAKLKMVLAGLQGLCADPMTDALWEQSRILRPAVLKRWRDVSQIHAFQKEIRACFDETDPMRVQMLSEQFHRMTYHILTKVDITSMAHAVEVRSPLLDHRVAEFARGLPSDFLVSGHQGKRILRDLARDELPPEVLAKPKAGFGIPVRDLFAKELRQYLADTLGAAHPVYDELVDRSRIPHLIDSHCAGKPYQTMLLLKLLALRLWIEQTQPRLA